MMSIPFPQIRGTARAHAPAIGVAVLAMVLVAAAMAVSYVSRVGFIVLVAALLGTLALATLRWPRAMLVVVVLAPIADRFVIAPFMPASVRAVTDFFSEGLLAVVSLVVLAVGLRAWRIIPAIRHPASVGVAGFLALAVISALLNGVPPITMASGLFYTFDAVAIFYLCRIVGFNRPQATWAIGTIGVAVLLMAVIGIGQGLLAPDILGLHIIAGRSGEAARIGSVVGNPNFLGSLIEMMLPFAFFGAVRLAGRRGRWTMIGVALLLCVGMLLTYSRGSWLGVVLGAGGAMLLLDRRVLLVAVGVVALALGVVTFMPRDLAVQSNPDGTVYKPPAFNIVDTTEERVGAVGKGRDLRTLLVVNAMPILADHLLLGVGPGWYGGAAAAHADSPIYRQYGTDKLLMFQETVDNFWLHILIEGGILGLAAFISILVAMGVQLIRALSGATGARYVLIAGILAGAAAMSVTTATTMGLEANTVAFMFWFLLGIGSLCLQTRPRAAS